MQVARVIFENIYQYHNVPVTHIIGNLCDAGGMKM